VGSNKAPGREEMRPSEASGQEVVAGEGRVFEIIDYLQLLTSSPTKSVGDFRMQEGMSNFSEEAAESGQHIKVFCQPQDIISTGHQIPLWFRDGVNPGEEVDGLRPTFGNWRAIFSRC
jgi:hypothetical protein